MDPRREPRRQGSNALSRSVSGDREGACRCSPRAKIPEKNACASASDRLDRDGQATTTNVLARPSKSVSRAARQLGSLSIPRGSRVRQESNLELVSGGRANGRAMYALRSTGGSESCAVLGETRTAFRWTRPHFASANGLAAVSRLDRHHVTISDAWPFEDASAQPFPQNIGTLRTTVRAVPRR